MIRFRLLSLALSQLILFSASVPFSGVTTASTRDALTLQFSSAPVISQDFYQVAGTYEAETLEWCTELVTNVFSILPEEHINAIHNLTLSFESSARRGLGGDNTVILRCVDMGPEELVSVLVHEIGHVVDTGLIEPTGPGEKTTFLDRGQPVLDTDNSFQYYSASWADSDKRTGNKWEFVSGYARTNPFEDFAEAYVTYVLHGPLFRSYAQENTVLAEKYDYLQNTVFNGIEFDFAPETTTKGNYERVYDMTRLDFDSESFLALRGSKDS